ncbi:MAG: tRNA guanosine(34) transglycosylase Tgt [Candidatus Riflebacteria bacterium]|nr:tRNA guanosine(34) transglycosylase Tgt [Candidatus Riflebacteria bacterium]
MNQFRFELIHESNECLGRTGKISTRCGDIETPVFMPVGTQGTVKTLSPDELIESNAQIILSNTYHLFLRPGTEVLEKFGGLHNFMAWPRPILTDSGGFQVFSLKTLNKITDEGVTFASHIDGSRKFLSPEEAIRIQSSIGSEIMMVFDECSPFPIEYNEAKEAMERSVRWALRCRKAHPAMKNGQALFGIIQGSMFHDLRDESLKQTVEIGFEGLAIGGLSVGEPKNLMLEVLEALTPKMPKAFPRYLMGVGTPEDLFFGVERGIDMFDCVHPTRIARHSSAFTRDGRIDLSAASHSFSDQPIDSTCTCATCRKFSRGYIRHLFKAGEILALRLASLHNVHFLINLMREIREALLAGTFNSLRCNFLERYGSATVQKKTTEEEN